MPNLTIYVSQDLAAEIRKHDINVSKVCQNALARKVRVRERQVAEALAKGAGQMVTSDDRVGA